ncbi:AMP-binding protein [Brevibacterium sp. RIT803]|nr:AMP-binding protein [Brevibacterium sp. RIT 803]MBM6588864.1 AMP-binding protein [Brevibacterium sp. RIT 803]
MTKTRRSRTSPITIPWTDPIENGWLRTGDLWRIDADGYLTISGRLKDNIVRGGGNAAVQLFYRGLHVKSSGEYLDDRHCHRY